MMTPPPPRGHRVDDGHCLCGADIPDSEAHAHYYAVSSPTMKVCPKDGTPLVMDFSVPQKEWRCVECGAFYAFWGEATDVPMTHELAVRYVAAKEKKTSA